MLKVYVKTLGLLDDLRSDKRGVVSLEYVVVASAIVAAVVLAFGNGTGGLGSALKNQIALIISAIPAP